MRLAIDAITQAEGSPAATVSTAPKRSQKPPNPTNGSLTLPSSLHSQAVIAPPLIPSSKPVNKGSTS